MRLGLQVVDIVSTWRSLGPELSCDSRPLVVKGVAELLALVPQLTVKSEEYEVARRHESSPPVVFTLVFTKVFGNPSPGALSTFLN